MLTNEIALKLIQYIVDRNLQVGSKLPSIRELTTLLDCNASQARTGLITLAALGIIDMHARAGSFVKELSPQDLDTLFVLFFRLGMLGKQTDMIGLYDVKALLDKEIFMNAVQYRTENDLIELEENLARQALLFGDIKAFVAADEEFHVKLARIIRNPVVLFLLEAIQVMLRPYRYENFNADICKDAYQGHVRLFKAIRTKNEAEAEKVAVLHTQPRLNRLKTSKEAVQERSK
ncbi:MAG: FCD domain-containing protein [Spirochaetaceae bacterium]|nr:FCD domain-containing protein [Spirochaetaceae bacterium]